MTNKLIDRVNSTAILYADTGVNEGIKNGFVELSKTVQLYLNIALGSIAGVLALAIIIILAIAFFKAGKAENEEERRAHLQKVKWMGIFLIAVVVLWAVEGVIITILQSVFASGKVS